MTPSQLRTRDFRRILLIKLSAVGDVIHTLPVLAKLRRRYPKAQIDWLLTPPIAEMIRHHPAVSNVLLFPRQAFSTVRGACSSVAGVTELLRTIRRTRYELVVDIHGQFRTALLTLASGAGVRIGFDRPQIRPWERSQRQLVREAYVHGWTGAREGAWIAYTHRIPLPTLDVHAVDRYLWVGPMLGFDDGPPQFQVPIPLESERKIEAVLGDAGLSHKPFAVLVPGTTWETKHWRSEGFAEVARYLTGNGHGVVFAGSAGERKLCGEVAVQCPGAINVAGLTRLSELAALVRRCAICVTNDSGSMHLAVALQRPVVSVFGPTDPVWIGPYQRPVSVVRAGVNCAPCYLRRLRDCPHNHACMRDVNAELVIAKVEQVLAADNRAAG